MRNALLSMLICLSAAPSYGQYSRDVYPVLTGKDINTLIPYAGKFQYPDFLNGQVHFRNGKISNAKINYSRVHGELMFISPARDTLLFAEPDFIERISMGENLFYYQREHGHVRIVGNFGSVELGRKEFLAKLGHEKNASYGQYSSTSAISSYSTFMNSTGEHRFLNINERVILKKREVFFLVDKNKRLYIANRNNLFKLFPSSKSAVSRFLKENETNFESEPDLEKLLTFCSSI
jgi:hypothetical protein